MMTSQEFVSNFTRNRIIPSIYGLEYIYNHMFGLEGKLGRYDKLVRLCMLEDWDAVGNHIQNWTKQSIYKEFYYCVKAYRRELRLGELC